MAVLTEKENKIEELHIKNFLSLDKVKVEFGKITILVGPNASGKSNLIKALTFLKRIARKDDSQNLQQICMKYLKIGSLKDLIHNSSEDAKIEVQLKVDSTDVSYEISFNSDGKVTNEYIKNGDKYLLDRVQIVTRKRERTYVTNRNEVEAIGVSSYQSFLSELPTNSHPLIKRVKEIFENIHTYSFNSDSIRSMASISFNLNLDRDGSNLAQVLHTLLTYERKRFLQIEEIMKSLIPEIEEIGTPPEKEIPPSEQLLKKIKTYLTIREKDIEGPLKYTNISDGTLRILAFVTALYLGGTINAFEEPENCVHPYLFESFVDLCKKTPTQVIITTHSPYLVSQVTPDELRLVIKTDGKTKINQVRNVKEVKKLLEEGWPLGEIWYTERLKAKKSP